MAHLILLIVPKSITIGQNNHEKQRLTPILEAEHHPIISKLKVKPNLIKYLGSGGGGVQCRQRGA